MLIVDDEAAISRLLSVNFARAGYQVSVASSAREAMALFEAGPFDAVLSDVDMPGMDGHELTRWVARNHPDTVRVLMSGYARECEQCQSEAGCPFLRKPFAPKEGVALVTSLLTERLN